MKKVKLREDIKIPKMSQNNVNSNCVPENGGRGGGQNGPPAHSMVKECVSLAQLIIIKTRRLVLKKTVFLRGRVR